MKSPINKNILLLAFCLGLPFIRLSAAALNDSVTAPIDTVTYRDVTVFNFRSKDDEREFLVDMNRIRAVLPYIKIAKQLYSDVNDKKETSKKREYRHYRKDLEKEMRQKFEKELKDLTIGQGKVLVKLINRETGNNCYEIIKNVKGGFSAWTWQLVARHYDYDLKEKYDPNKEWVLELALKSLGPEYDVH